MKIALKRLKSLKCQFLLHMIFEASLSQIPKILGSIPVTFLVKNSESRGIRKSYVFLIESNSFEIN